MYKLKIAHSFQNPPLLIVTIHCICRAVKISKEAFDNAISELDTLSEDCYKDSTLHMQLLRDQLTDMTQGGTDEDARSGYKGAPAIDKSNMDAILFLQHPEGCWNLNEVLRVLRIDQKKFEDFIVDEVRLQYQFNHYRKFKYFLS